ncbi:MAG: response regulator transcription factor [Bdellovibrionaceae bacterium]|nr:response regulator transcription factor [Pseudobdellovibrionaceae bacterium]
MSQTTSLRILVVEDENEIREFLVSQFEDHGMHAEGLSNGDAFLQRLEQFQPNIIVMDQMMPGKSGTELIRELRGSLKFSEVPVIVLTGLDGEAEKVAALEMGADDYVTKPFSVKEVVARVQALVRRSQATHKSQQKNMSIQDLHVDLIAHRVTLKGAEVALTLTEFKILVELMRQAGQVLTRDRLRERALGNLNVTDRTIDVHMASLRKKLEEMGDKIETVRGVGYRLAVQ